MNNVDSIELTAGHEASNNLLTTEIGQQDDSFINNQDIIKDEFKGFDKFTTVDCIIDSLMSNDYKLHDFKANRNASTFSIVIGNIVSSSRSWLCLTLIGVLIGTIAAALTIVTEYLNNIKNGYCSTNFYLNRNFCCWGEDLESCEQWVSWTSFEFFNYLMFVILSVLLAVTAGILVKRYAPFAAGSGISEIKCIVSGFELQDFLNWPTLFIKAIGLPLAIASGLSVGKEGPSVHYAVAAGYCVTNTFKLYRSDYAHLKEFLIASSAAGVAVAFGSPIGGVLFSVEEIASSFKLSTLWKSYFCSLVAVSTLSFINPFRTGQLVMFEVEYDESWHLFEIPFFIILGIFGGIYGIVVSKYNIKVVAFRKKYLGNYAIKELFVLSSVTALFCYFNEFLKLDMTECMEILFHECGVGFEHRLCNIDGHKLKIFSSLLFATGFRMILTIISYGCKVPCGIFVPSMAAGATFGRAVGIVVENFRNRNPDGILFSACSSDKQCITPGTYAFLGAAAALSGITDLTVTVVVIMFELTGALRYILPTMIVVGVTKMINDKWGHGAIADQMIKFNGLPFIDPKEDHVFNLSTSHAMTSDVYVIPRDGITTTFQQLQKLLAKEEHFQDIPIVESLESPFLVGYINRNNIEKLISSILFSSKIEASTICDFATVTDKVSEEGGEEEEEEGGGGGGGGGGIMVSKLYFNRYMNQAPITVSTGTPLEETMEIFFRTSPRTIFVEDKGLLKGIITKKDVIKFERYLEKLEEHGFDLNGIRNDQEYANNSLKYDTGYRVFSKFKQVDDLIMKKIFKKNV
ncbi:Gef1 protein [Saccharomycopsis crataegensis]|uniref:Chloride channel protein n=1 Tax=Saccharomycopsis crataegensis TaxID=43959 RepID=A0AAV5QDF8_9ASCO|nr:Gef1 protein [Saccharomycopsis crataegensis]